MAQLDEEDQPAELIARQARCRLYEKSS